MVDGHEIEPIWTKKQGDHEYKKSQFKNAHAYYTKCLKGNKEFLMVRLNRATVFLKMRDYQCCLEDLDDIENHIAGLDYEVYNLDP